MNERYGRKVALLIARRLSWEVPVAFPDLVMSLRDNDGIPVEATRAALTILKDAGAVTMSHEGKTTLWTLASPAQEGGK